MTITPNKNVKANQKIAIEEVANVFGVDETTLGYLYRVSLKTDKPFLSEDFKLPIRFYAKAENDGLLESNLDAVTWEEMYSITKHGQKLIDAINGRLATRKAVKQGIDLFPMDANIPELRGKPWLILPRR